MSEYLREKGDNPANCVHVRKAMSKWLLCAENVKVKSPLHTEKFPTEYSNSSNPLMSKMVHFGRDQFGKFKAHSQIHIASIFMRDYLLKNGVLRHGHVTYIHFISRRINIWITNVTVNTAGVWFDTAEDTFHKKKETMFKY